MTTMAETYPYSRVELTILCAKCVSVTCAVQLFLQVRRR